MPWKGEKDPYKIWLSEIILQQTRVEQGWNYYNRFVEKYPRIQDLAAAPDASVFKLWEGLGYYSRCSNLLATARIIVKDFEGKFPKNHKDISGLKGVGPYTAAAIASFAYNLPYAVVDGNVMRVLARYFGITEAVDSVPGKKIFQQLAQELLHKKKPGLYNQAIMDFGATVCKPQQPLCAQCLLNQTCVAKKKNMISLLPLKEKKLKKKQRFFYYILARWRNGYYIRQRNSKDIWQHLHEFILIETGSRKTARQLLASATVKKYFPAGFDLHSVSAEYRQQLTHQTIYGSFIHIKLQNEASPEGYSWVSQKKLKGLAFTGFIKKYTDNQIIT